MHLHNIELGKRASPEFEPRFGFDIPTCCGDITQKNQWNPFWVVSLRCFYNMLLVFIDPYLQGFYAQKLQDQFDLIPSDDEVHDLWNRLKPTIPDLFSGIEVKPSILHGDLWSGNAASAEGEAGKHSESCTRPISRFEARVFPSHFRPRLVLRASRVRPRDRWHLSPAREVL